MTLGQKIRQTRQDRGMTQQALAGSRITRNMLSQIENDLARPSVRTLEYLAAMLGVEAGWLLSDTDGESAADRLASAGALLRAGEDRACLELLRPDAAQAGDEALLILARAGMRLAYAQFAQEQLESAVELAREALLWDARSLYTDPLLQNAGQELLCRVALIRGEGAQAAVEAYRALHALRQEQARYHLVLARYHLSQEHIQAAEKEIWSIAELPEAQQAEYLILRGRIAIHKEQFENAQLYLQQAEQAQPHSWPLLRELYAAMEQCCREREDYKAAYEYAMRQREL